jgi:pimeloyl-ACP methyl ester carboxylesterase
MPVQSFQVRQQTLRIHHEGTSGPVVLFGHGFPMHHGQWQPQWQRFARTCRVVAPDLRGMGGSTITDAAAVVTMEQHADDLVAVLDQLGLSEPVVFVGLSMGGYVGWQLAKKYPARVRGLVQCHTRIIADTPAAAAGRHNLAAQLLKENSTQAVEDAFIPKLLAPNPPASLVELVRQMARAATPAGLAANLRGLAVREDVAALLPTIRMPTKVISGEHDAISPPSEMQAWATQIAGARFVSIPGVGHLSPLEAPDTFIQCLAEFLTWCTGMTNP